MENTDFANFVDYVLANQNMSLDSELYPLLTSLKLVYISHNNYVSLDETKDKFELEHRRVFGNVSLAFVIYLWPEHRIGLLKPTTEIQFAKRVTYQDKSYYGYIDVSMLNDQAILAHKYHGRVVSVEMLLQASNDLHSMRSVLMTAPCFATQNVERSVSCVDRKCQLLIRSVPEFEVFHLDTPVMVCVYSMWNDFNTSHGYLVVKERSCGDYQLSRMPSFPVETPEYDNLKFVSTQPTPQTSILSFSILEVLIFGLGSLYEVLPFEEISSMAIKYIIPSRLELDQCIEMTVKMWSVDKSQKQLGRDHIQFTCGRKNTDFFGNFYINLVSTNRLNLVLLLIT